MLHVSRNLWWEWWRCWSAFIDRVGAKLIAAKPSRWPLTRGVPASPPPQRRRGRRRSGVGHVLTRALRAARLSGAAGETRHSERGGNLFLALWDCTCQSNAEGQIEVSPIESRAL